MQHMPLLKQIVDDQKYPLLFATVSGAHLYGFESPDSDVDLRGVHILPMDEVLGLYARKETIETERDPTPEQPIELDLVTHDIEKFMTLMLKKNGLVLEQLHSPLVVSSLPEFEELKVIAKDCVTRHHIHHYRGFAENQWKLFTKEDPPRVKPLLYIFRVLLTGIHLMRTGEMEPNLNVLIEYEALPWIPDLIQLKREGAEKGRLDQADLGFYESEFKRLTQLMIEASDESTLPETPSAKAALNDLLLRVRRNYG